MNAAATPPRPVWIPVLKRRGEHVVGVWFRFDPVRWVVEVQERGVKHSIDLAQVYSDWLAAQVEEHVDAA